MFGVFAAGMRTFWIAVCCVVSRLCSDFTDLLVSSIKDLVTLMCFTGCVDVRLHLGHLLSVFCAVVSANVNET